MDADKFRRLLKINEDFIAICQWLNQSRDSAVVAQLINTTDDLTRLVAEVIVEGSAARAENDEG